MSVDHCWKWTRSGRHNEVSSDNATVWADGCAPIVHRTGKRYVINAYALTLLNSGLRHVDGGTLVVTPVMKERVVGLLSQRQRGKQNKEKGKDLHA
jgi:hypothetical protein